MLDANGNSIIQIQAVQSHLSWGCEAAQEQAYECAREDSNLAMIFSPQPHHLFQFMHLSIYLFCAKGFLKKSETPVSRKKKTTRKPFLLFKNHLFVSP